MGVVITSSSSLISHTEYALNKAEVAELNVTAYFAPVYEQRAVSNSSTFLPCVR